MPKSSFPLLYPGAPLLALWWRFTFAGKRGALDFPVGRNTLVTNHAFHQKVGYAAGR